MNWVQSDDDRFFPACSCLPLYAATPKVLNLLVLGFLYSAAMGDAVGIHMSRRLGEGTGYPGVPQRLEGDSERS